MNEDLYLSFTAEEYSHLLPRIYKDKQTVQVSTYLAMTSNLYQRVKPYSRAMEGMKKSDVVVCEGDKRLLKRQDD